MKLPLRYLLLLLVWTTWGVPRAAWAQCAQTNDLDFTAAATPADDWKAHAAVTVTGTTTTLSSGGYTSTVATAGGTINTFAVSANGALPNKALVWQQDNSTAAGNLATVTFTFNAPVTNLVLRLSDIDQDLVNANFTDKVTFNGYNTTSATPNTAVTLSAANFTFGRNDANSANSNQFAAPNALVGIGTSNNNNLGTSTVTFPSPVDKITLVYENPAPSNGGKDRTQTLGIESLTFCSLTDVMTTLATAQPTAAAGASVTYTATVLNNGPATATGVAPQVQLPAGLAGVVVPGGGTYNAATGLVTLPTTAALAPGNPLTYAITFTAPSVASTVTGVASSVSTSTDPTATNNNGSAAAAKVQTLVTAPSCQPSFLTNTTALSGLTAEYYAGNFADDVTYFQRVAPLRRNDPTADFSTGNGSATWGDLSSVATGSATAATGWDTYSARYRGSLSIAQAGSYTFYLNSDDASYLWLDGAALAPTVANATINNGGGHGVQERTATVTLTAGLHDITIAYGEIGGDNYLKLEYASAANNIARQVLPQGLLCAGPAATNTPPVAIDATNANLPNSAGATVLNPNLSGTDPDGNATISYYNIVTLPAAGSGVLLYNGVAMVVGQAIPAGSLNLLTFNPAAGTAGTTSFTYSVTDTGGRTDLSPATYSIPVTSVDLATTLSGPATAVVGQTVYYLANTTNLGSGAATSAVVTITLPGKPAAGTVTVTNGTYNAATGVVTFNAQGLAAGATVINSVAFVVTAAGTSTGTAASSATEPDAVAANNNGSAASASVSTVATATGPAGTPAPCATPGKDGSPTALATNPNTYFPSTVTQTVAANATSLTLGAGTGPTAITAGDLLLVIQMQGADLDASNTDSYGDGGAGGSATGNLTTNFTAGQYEYVVAANAVPLAGGPLTLASGLKFGYQNAAATATAGQRRFQVVRIPQYANLTLGGNLTAAAWDGSVGGLLVLDVAGTLNFAGFTLDASGKGFRGGAGRQLGGAGAGTTLTGTDYRSASATNANAQKGEGLAGTPQYVLSNGTLLNTGVEGYPNGSAGRGAPGNAGGGGTDSNPAANNQNTGGGGGANGGRGGRGGNAWNSGAAVGGEPGAALGVASSNRLTLGGGGGAGNTNDGTGGNAGLASSGASGGGLVLIRTGAVSGTGTIAANGGSAGNAVQNDGSGGGGAGGSILLTARVPAGLSGIALSANGGTGGTNNPGADAHGPGGGGGGGLLLANGTVASASANGGANGVTNSTNNAGAFGALAGTTGVVSVGISNSIANSVSGADCAFDVATTLTGPASANAGQTLSFTATFTNNGPGTAANVARTAQLPAGATNVVVPTGATYNAGTGVIDFGPATTLVNGATNSFAFSYTAPGAGPLTTTSTVNGGAGDLVAGNNTASVTTSVTLVSDVTTTLTAPASIAAGQPSGTYTATFTNNGPSTASTVTRTVTLPAGVTSVVVPTGATYNAATRVIDFGTVASQASGATASFAFSYTAPTTGPLTVTSNTGTATGQGGNSAPDAASTTTPVTAVADVTTALTGPTTLNAGQPSGTYTATFTNNGPSTAATVAQTVTLPVGVTNVVVPTGATYTAATRVIDFGTAATVASGATNSFGFSYTAPTTTGAVGLTANVSTATSQGPNTAPDAATLTATVNAVADVATTITAPTGPVLVGQSGTFTVTFTNNGPQAAVNVTRQVQLPAGLTGVAATNGGTYNAATGLVSYPSTGTLASGANLNSSITFTVPATATVAATSTIGTASNEAGLTTNNSASATLNSAAVADVTTTLTGPAVVNPGQPSGTYTATFTNNGPSTASTVTRTVTLPAGVTSVVVPTGASYDPTTRVIDFGPATTLASGGSNSFGFSYSAPTTPGSVSLVSTTSTTTSQGANPAADQATLAVRVNAPPVASNVTNTPSMPNTANATAINALSATDADGSVASYKILSLPATNQGILYLNGAAVTVNQVLTPTQATQLSFDPSGFSYGNFTFTYAATDNDGLTGNTATYTIPVTAGPLTAYNDSNEVPRNMTATGNVLLNDANPSASPLTTTLLTGPTNGTVVLNADGTYTYTPANNYLGPDSFTYQVCDNGSPQKCSSATVALRVYDPGTACSSSTGTNLLANPDFQGGNTGFLSDYNYVSPAANSASGGQGLVPEATYAVDVNANTYHPAWRGAGFGGTSDNFLIINGAASVQRMYSQTITVQPNRYYTFSAYFNNLLPPGSNNNNPVVGFVINGQSVSASLVVTESPDRWVKFSDVWYSGSNTQATFEIRNVSLAAGGNDLGIDQVYFGTCNLPPVANNDLNATAPGVAVSFSATGNDTDGDGTVNVATVDLDPSTPGLQPSFTDASGNLFQVNNAGLVTFTPAAGFTGTASIPYVVQDNNGALSNPGTLSVVVQNAPVDLAVSISTPANNTTVPASQPLTFTVVQQNNGPVAAAAVQTTLQLPANLSGVSFGSSGGSYNAATGLVTFPVLASQANAGSITYGVTVNAPANGPVTATAAVRSASADTNPANNTAAVTLSLTPRFDVASSLSGPTSVLRGNEATFTVLTSNNGPSIAPNVGQTVQLPSGLANVFVSNNGTYDGNNGLVTFPVLPLLPSGQTVVNTISFTAPAAGFTATAAVTPNTTAGGDTNTGNNAASAAATTIGTPTATQANVYTSISLSAASVAPGGAVTVSVSTGNRGPAAATGVATQVSLLPGLTVTGLPTGASYDAATGLVTFAPVASLTSGATQSYLFTFTAPQQGTVTATASVASTTSDPVAADNVAAAQVTVQPRADLATTLAGPATATAGQPVTYTVTTQNLGPAPASGVGQTVQLPTGLSGVTATNGGSYDPTTGLVSFPALATAAPGSLSTSAISFLAPAGMSSFAATAAVSSTTPDYVAANNTAAVTTTVQAAVDVVTTVTGPAAAPVFGPVTYAVTTTNNGPSTAAMVVPTLQLPANLNGVVVPAGASYNTATGLVTFAALSNLLSGGASTSAVTFLLPDVAQVTGLAADAVSSPAERDLTNNRASITTLSQTPGDQVADLSAAVTASAASTTPGTPVTFTATFTNGPAATSDAAQNVVSALVLPAGLSGVSVSNGGTYNAATGVVSWPATASLAPATALVYTVTVNAPGSGPLVATAAVSSANSDPTPANNVASASVGITPVADVTTSVSGSATAPAGATVSYAVTTRNNGPSAAANVGQTLTLPTGATNVVLPAGATLSGSVVTFAPLASQAPGVGGQVTNIVSFTAPAAVTYAVTANVSTTTSEGANAAPNTATTATAQANQPPVAQNVVNALQAPMGNTAGALPVAPLAGTDADGTVTSFAIALLPPATQGVLYLNGGAVAVGQVLTPAQAAQLSFDPAAGFVGNVFLVYTATDNQGAVSNPALYTIPVGLDMPALYTTTPVKGGVTAYQNGDVIANVFDVNGGSYNAAAPQAITDDGVRSATTNAAGTALLAGLGVSMDPTTGQFTLTDRTKLKAGTYTVSVTTVDVNGGVTTQPVTFTIGTNPLPVELTAFTATAVQNRDALLNWTTASELNSAYFDVERSLDGTTFTKVGQVAAQVTKTTTSSYALTDAGIGLRATGQVYYRLRQVDLDDKVSYSPVRVVSFAKVSNVALTLYPNPAQQTTNLDLSQLPAAGRYQVQVLDATARTVLAATLAGGLPQPLDLTGLATGTYHVLVTGTAPDGSVLRQVLRLVKE